MFVLRLLEHVTDSHNRLFPFQQPVLQFRPFYHWFYITTAILKLRLRDGAYVSDRNIHLTQKRPGLENNRHERIKAQVYNFEHNIKILLSFTPITQLLFQQNALVFYY
jgi:hypothetical protein